MARLSQVTRTDDKGGPVQPRELSGGCMILCSTVDYGYCPAEVAQITVSASEAYQRVFVAATISLINVYVNSGCY